MPVRKHDRTRLFVCSHQCDTCIFGPESPLSGPKRLAEHLRGCQERKAPVNCHHTTLNGLQTICRGFFDRFKDRDDWPVFRLGMALGLAYQLDSEAEELPARGEETPLRT